MAKKSGALTVFAALGAAAAAAALWYKREEIRDLLDEAKERFCGSTEPEDEPEGWDDGEGDLIIDVTAEESGEETDGN